MIVECNRCSTKFKIADEKVTDRGVKVRCSKCKHLFMVKKSGVAELDEPRVHAFGETQNKAVFPDGRGVPDSVFKAPTKVAEPPPSMPSITAGAGDVFSRPTRVAPAPAAVRPKFPVPPPSPLGDGRKSLADQIDLDSDDAFRAPSPPSPPAQSPLPAAPSSLPPKPQAPATPPISVTPRAPLPPPPAPRREAAMSPHLPPSPAGARSDLSDDLFGDLGALESEGPAPSALPAKPPAPSAKPPAPREKTPASPPSPRLDDPFAGIDISDSPSSLSSGGLDGVDAGQPSSTLDPVSGEAVGKPTTDLFGDLGDPFAALPKPPEAVGDQGSADDPFASIDAASSTSSVVTAPPPDAAQSTDPFASLDQAIDQSPTDFGGDLTDNDPFGQLDTSAEDDVSESSGLQLGEDGKLTGEDLPEPPAPTKTLVPNAATPGGAPAQSQPASPAPMALTKPADHDALRPPSMWLYKIGFGVIGLLMAILLFVAYRSGGKPDLTAWSTYVQAFTGRSSLQTTAGELIVEKIDNTIYPNQDGHPLVVLWGEVENPTDSEKQPVAVTAMLVNKQGHVAYRKTIPAGLTFTPEEVYKMLDGPAVDAAYRRKLGQGTGPSLAPGGKAAFMVVFFDHPDEMHGMEFRAEAKSSTDPLLGLPPEPETPEEATGGQETGSRPIMHD
ncbi:MAG TPA: zinc-ribbon domain-containing protein [Myxococcota bacterium]|nr:zinc-ribbon domain-containing protein [Myxococcota bacterium]